MTYRYKNVTGFTLIELLVVLTISMTAVGLVGGLSIDFIAKYRAQSEFNTLIGTLKKAGDLAFIVEKPIVIVLQQESIVVKNDDKVLLTQSFDYIFFTPLEFSFSPLGQASISAFEYSLNARQSTLSLWTLTNES